MNISRKWLREFVDITATDKEYDSVMTLAGQKVETTERMDAEIKNVVVGKVLSMKKHENSDHMWVCMVDCGAGEPVQIGVLAGAFDQAEIDIHGSHRRRHARRVADREPHGRARVGAAKARQLGRHQVAGNGGAGAHVQRQCAAGQQRLAFLGLAQQRLRARQQQAAVFVEPQPAPVAIEQALPKRLLQPGQRLAGGRLGQVHGIGGAPDVVV